MNLKQWKKLLILFLVVIFINIGFGSDSLKVAIEDWKFLETTFLKMDSSLNDCEKINTMYRKITSNFQNEIFQLRSANLDCDTLLKKYQKIDTLRNDQINILKDEIKKKTIEIWIMRITASIILILSLTR